MRTRRDLAAASVYSENEWRGLHSLGIQRGSLTVPDIELRLCASCKTTLAMIFNSKRNKSDRVPSEKEEKN